ncbi:MAG: A/G-specific adenine glycosylase [Elusimicrobiaceae bacterium]|nr:A/G-specific adenine glycosylase [Elusimicrobiaceae bacterium]
MKSFSSILLAWYEQNKRNLPWRHTKDPYKIWLCEIIMQQTRVAQGLTYYNRFVETFPTSADLARATEDQVLKLWQGLGYYSRARNLHAAAKSMNGVFPPTYDGVRALKGVGDYTAAAICSIAYDMPYAVVDGNVYRVLSRVFGIDTPIDGTEGKKQFTELAQQLLDKQNPGDYNQAIMDFGAMVCTPQAPQCLMCPLVNMCKSYKEGTQEKLPVKALKTKITTRYFHYIYVEQGQYTWLHQRGAGDVWQNLYEPPLLETADGKFKRHSLQLSQWFGRSAQVVPVSKTPLKHVLSHRIIYASLYKVVVPPSRKLPEEFIQVQTKDLPKYAVSRLVQKLLEKL